MKIRRMKEEDFPQVVAMSLGMKADEEGFGFTGYGDDGVFAVYVAETLFERQTRENQILLVADLDDGSGGLAGMILGYVGPPAKCSRFEQVAFCDVLYVAPDYRNQHVATELCLTFQGEAKALGAEMIIANIYMGNSPTQFGLLARGFRYELVQMVKEI